MPALENALSAPLTACTDVQYIRLFRDRLNWNSSAETVLLNGSPMMPGKRTSCPRLVLCTTGGFQLGGYGSVRLDRVCLVETVTQPPRFDSRLPRYLVHLFPIVLRTGVGMQPPSGPPGGKRRRFNLDRYILLLKGGR